MDNPETLSTLGTQDKHNKQTNTTQQRKPIRWGAPDPPKCTLLFVLSSFFFGHRIVIRPLIYDFFYYPFGIFKLFINRT